MKKTYDYIMKRRFLLTLFAFINFNNSFSQQYIIWNQATNLNGLSGSYGVGGIVNAIQTGGGIDNVAFISPANVQNNLVVVGPNTFSTVGPDNQPPSRSLTFNFSTPVIITRYNMADIDLGVNGWDDSFNFSNISFSNNPAPINVNCNATLLGVQATTTNNIGGNASWFCSNPISSFSVDYQTTNGLTHAYLAYSIQVLIPPTLEDICLNSPSPNFPIIGNNIEGTWNPPLINTSLIGNTNYVFTPNEDQPIQCPINMNVNIINCCQLTLTSSSTISSMLQIERDDWISSSDFVIFGDGITGNGVVYHAKNFVELTPGFESTYGSQFAAYPEGCNNPLNYVYRNHKESLISNIVVGNNSVVKKSNFTVNIDDSKFANINSVDISFNEISVFSLDEKIVFKNRFKNTMNCKFDIQNFSKGIYIVTIKTENDQVFSEKVIIN